MKIAVVNTMVGFVRGGAEVLADDLCSNLEQRGHKVDLFKLPFPIDCNLNKIIESIFTTFSLRFDEYDRVIPMKFPVFYVLSRNKVPWICHQFRQIYDLWNSNLGGLNENEIQHIILKKIVKNLDDTYISNARDLYCIADEVSIRLKQFNNISSKILYPPLLDVNKYYFESIGDYIYYPSRVNITKRQNLLVEAFAYVKSDAKLIISGAADNEGDARKIEDLVKKYKLSNKVQYIDGWIREEDKLKYYANSLAVAFLPYIEDYGYITAEAMYSHKPVITCTDSGGPKWIVEDGKSGFVVEPDPKKLAEKIDYLFNTKEEARKMGEKAYERIISFNMSWDNIISSLLEQ